jgi:site-specific DNA recombinase
VQGLVSCSKCGYALSRTSTRSSARNIHYYRCLGSDAWRRLGGRVCDNRPVRQDLLDQVVWAEVVRLLEDPSLIKGELDRRLTAARTTDPARQREKGLQRELTRTRKSMDRLLTAYQEELLSLDELRRRMPELRQREHATQTELQSILDQINDRAVYLRLAESLSSFLARLRTSAGTLDIQERQRIVRLVIKEILIGDETIVIRHSIPLSSTPPNGNDSQSAPSVPVASGDQSYLLRSGRQRTALRGPLVHRKHQAALHHPGGEKCPDEFEHALVGYPHGDAGHEAIVVHSVEEFLEIEVNHDVVALGNVALRLGHRLMRRAPRSEAVAMLGKRRVPSLLQHLQHGLLDQSVDHARHAELSDPAVRLGYFDPLHRLWLVGSVEQLGPYAWPVLTQVVLGVVDGHPIHPALPWFLLTRFHALWRFSRSHTSSMSCSVTAGLSGAGFAASGSTLRDPTTGASPRPFGSEASECWAFCRFPLMRSQSYLPLPIVRAFTHRSRLGLSVAPPFGLECLK